MMVVVPVGSLTWRPGDQGGSEAGELREEVRQGTLARPIRVSSMCRMQAGTEVGEDVDLGRRLLEDETI